MSELELLYRVGLALAIGFVVGIERGWHEREQASGTRAAGIRTFALVGLLGGVAALLSNIFSAAVLVVAFLGVFALTIAGYVAKSRQSDTDRGLTTEVAFLLTFALGAYAVVGEMALAAGAGVVTVVLLRLKPELHRFLDAIDRLELNSAIRLLVISVVILPLLPNRGFGPGGAVNPFILWWMVVLISALSFAGYLAIKLAGPRRGPILAGIFGGLASSTAATLGFSRLARRNPALAPLMARGIGLACTIMFVRMIVIAGFLDADLALRLVVPLGAMAAVLLVMALLLTHSIVAPNDSMAMDMNDPADIPAALKFGILLLVLTILSHYLRQYVGESGMYALALVAGLADVDAIILTLAQHLGETATAPALHETVARAIVLAAISNTVVKAIMAGWIGGRTLAFRVIPALGLATIVGIVVASIG